MGYDTRMKQWTFTVAALLAATAALVAQDRLKTMPGYEQFQKLSAQIPTAIKSGALTTTWTSDSRSIEYTRDGKRYSYEIASRRTTEVSGGQDAGGGRGRRRCPSSRVLP